MKKYAIYTPTRYQMEAVQKACEERGLSWFNLKPNWSANEERSAIGLTAGGNGSHLHNKIGWGSVKTYEKDYGFTIISPDEFFSNMDKYLEQPMMIGSYSVTDITADGFKVGCQLVTWKQYEEIGRRRPE